MGKIPSKGKVYNLALTLAFYREISIIDLVKRGRFMENMEKQEKQEQQEKNALLEFDVHIDSKVLYDYLLKHTYSGMQGILATVVGALMIMMFLSGEGILYLIFGIVVIVYIPFSLFLSANRQALQVEAFGKPLHYRLLEEGIEVSQDDIVELQAWEDMVKAISTGKSIIVYTSRYKAAIFPRKDLANHVTDTIEIISTHMDPKKVKIKQ